MNSIAIRQHQVSRFKGMADIVRYNWPFYLSAILITLTAAIVLNVSSNRPLNIALKCAMAIAFWWAVTSLIASHWIYDRSELTSWRWLRNVVSHPSARILNIHAGLDHVGPLLCDLFPQASCNMLDIYDPRTMSEPSIRRARRIQGAASGSPGVDSSNLPLESGSVDLVLLIFAAHEIREPSVRHAFFRELSRVLTPTGRIILVEHHRDAANFLAYGPGFLHFLSPRTWRRAAGHAGFQIRATNWFTPFVRCQTWERRNS